MAGDSFECVEEVSLRTNMAGFGKVGDDFESGFTTKNDNGI